MAAREPVSGAELLSAPISFDCTLMLLSRAMQRPRIDT